MRLHFLCIVGVLLSIVSCSSKESDEDEPTSNKIVCENGFAGDYPCNGYDLLLHIDLNSLDAGAANDSWGWTDASTGNEYAIIGLTNGTAFIDITNTEEPIYLGKLPTATEDSSWRDIKVYNNPVSYTHLTLPTTPYV